MSEEVIKKFFIEDEKKFKEEDILRLIEKVGKYAKLVGKHGKVHIEKSFRGSGTEKLKLFLIVRYLGSELSRLKPDLGIKEEIANVTIDDIVTFLSLPDTPKGKGNARARMSALVEEDFAEKIRKGVIRVRPYQIEKFIDYLEKKKESYSRPKSQKKKRGVRKKIEKKVIINKEMIYSRLSKNLELDVANIRDTIFMDENGFFKFNKMLKGKTKMETQKNCILCCCYVVSVGFGKEKIESRLIKEVCYHSDIDVTGLRFALKDLKRGGYLKKTMKGHQENILLEKGKIKAKEIFIKVCGKK